MNTAQAKQKPCKAPHTKLEHANIKLNTAQATPNHYKPPPLKLENAHVNLNTTQAKLKQCRGGGKEH